MVFLTMVLSFPRLTLPKLFPGVWLHPAPPVNVPPADGLRNLAGRYLNNPNTRVNLLRIEPGPGGRFEVWIALELNWWIFSEASIRRRKRDPRRHPRCSSFGERKSQLWYMSYSRHCFLNVLFVVAS